MVGYFGLPFVMSLYLQQQRGLSDMDIGTVFLPMMSSGLFLTPFSARLVERFGARALIVTGLASMTLGLTAVTTLSANTPVWLIAIQMLLVGLVGPLVAPPITTVLLSSVPAVLVGTAGGVFNTSRQIGGALAMAAFGALLVQSSSLMAELHASLLIAEGISSATVFACLCLRSLGPERLMHAPISKVSSLI
ncbi:MFS transporter [Paralcaligenes ureilyticus]|uniref:MFS transporter n=1 Tax=Paralcaligenes ureilyticus TaxID=627131 RepID=A0A4R3M978_9BURK|nr:MFS transporter [Paralcaligenes ureilyticus]TCT09672.1 MFS transporter [Paralcaligenes ureilyticus]